jgi:hypothetical protein
MFKFERDGGAAHCIEIGSVRAYVCRDGREREEILDVANNKVSESVGSEELE